MPRTIPQTFRTNVFINCPFDEAYKSLLRPMLFTVIYFGFNPRLASERSDSLEQRIDKILSLIKQCRYSIHDMSRLKAEKIHATSRFNMPFELGVDYGCRRISMNYLKTKKSLILEKRQYDIKRALSDLSGVDIKSHNNSAAKIVQALQHWFIETVGVKDPDSPSRIWDKFNEFTFDFYEKRKTEGYSKTDLKMMPIPQYVRFIKHWVAANS
jgi:hypothetical protein